MRNSKWTVIANYTETMVYTLFEFKEVTGNIILSNDGAEYIEKYMLSASN